MTDDSDPYPDGPPTLPLPPLWRLLVAFVVVVGFLFFLYRWNLPDEPSAEPQKSEMTTPAAA